MRPSSHADARRSRSASLRSAVAAAALQHVDAGRARATRADSSRRIRRPVALPPACTTRRARVPALQPEREVAAAVGVEVHAERLEVAEARGRLVAEHRGGRARGRARGRRRPCPRRCSSGESSAASAAASPPCAQYDAVSASGRADTSVDARAGARGGQRGEQARGAGSHDDEVGPVARARGTGTVLGVPPASGSATTPRSRTTCPGHPERPARIVALEAEMERHGWFGCERVAAPRGDARAAGAVHPARHIDGIEELVRARRRGDRHGHRRGARHVRGGAAGGGRRRRAGRRAAGRGRAGRRLRAAPARPSRRAGAGDGLLLLQQRRGRRAARPRRARRSSACSSSTGTSITATAPTTIFHADPTCCSSRIHEWPLYPGTGPASDVGSGAGAGHTVNLPVPGGSGDETYRRSSSTSPPPLIRAWAPELVLVSAGFDAHRDDPLATCRVTEAGLRGDDRHRCGGRARRWAPRSGSCWRAATPSGAGGLDGGADAGARRPSPPARRDRTARPSAGRRRARAACAVVARAQRGVTWRT